MTSVATSPENGPRILFFSGGTALRATSRELIRYTHNSAHIITPLDSGGSSAVLRHAFRMLAVGDIRNRLMALADLSEKGSREIFALFTYRFPKNATVAGLVDELRRMINGKHILVDLLPDAKRAVIRAHLRRFLETMPPDFDLRGASVGNLILAAGYLGYERQLAPVIDGFCELARVRGVVRPVVDKDLHMAAELEDGRVVVGQHLLTGKEVSPLSSKVKQVWMTDSLASENPVSEPVAEDVRELILQADLICFPIGSFYSSVVANLLPDGVGKAVAANPCPKVFVPNPIGDPELLGHTVVEQVELLRSYLVAGGAPDGLSVLQIVLVDSRADYPGGLNISELESIGVEVMDVQLITDDTTPMFSPSLLAKTLISLVD